MRRQILKYPVNQQFKEILEDDHEWEIITDVHLNPLVMIRSDRKEAITQATVKKAYELLKQKIPDGKQVRIIELHTHPSGAMIPSPHDMKKFLEEKIINPYKVSLAGNGIITKKGIFIIKLHGTPEKLKHLYWNFPDEYKRESLLRVVNKVDDITPERVEAIRSGKIKLRKKTRNIFEDANIRTFDKMQRGHSEIKTETIRRTHRFNLRRRR